MLVHPNDVQGQHFSKRLLIAQVPRAKAVDFVSQHGTVMHKETTQWVLESAAHDAIESKTLEWIGEHRLGPTVLFAHQVFRI